MNLNGLHREPTTYERPIYGSSRLGIMNKAVKSPKSAVCSLSSFPLSRTDYYPFGYPIASRSFSLEQYRYGFNGQEGDDEVYGNGKSYTAEYWQYDSRLGRRWNVDPIIKPSLSAFSTFANNPIIYKDFFGLDSILYNQDGSQTYRTGGENVVILPETEINDVFNPYPKGSLPYRVVENNRYNPNLWNNRSTFKYNTSSSQWQKDFNKAFGWMIPTAILAPVAGEFSGGLLQFSIETGPALMGTLKSGSGFLKYQGARTLIYGSKIYNVCNYSTLYIGSYISTGLFMNRPVSFIFDGTSFVSGIYFGYKLNNYNILSPDLSSPSIWFDIGLNYGQIINNYQIEIQNLFRNNEKKNE